MKTINILRKLVSMVDDIDIKNEMIVTINDLSFEFEVQKELLKRKDTELNPAPSHAKQAKLKEIFDHSESKECLLSEIEMLKEQLAKSEEKQKETQIINQKQRDIIKELMDKEKEAEKMLDKLDSIKADTKLLLKLDIQY